jgi:hypothetical protein
LEDVVDGMKNLRRRGAHAGPRRKRLAWGVVTVATMAVSTAFGVATFGAFAAPIPGSTPGVAAEPPAVSNPSPGPAPVKGVGDDPLTSQEVDKARAVALTSELAESAKDVTDGKGPEYLFSEIVEGGTGRDAAFYFYDYHTNELVKQIVDITAGKVTGSFRAGNLQLPASDREVATALDLLLADPIGADVRELYTKVTGKPWTGKDQLKVQAHIYNARPADTEASQCGEHRCVQLVARVTDGPFVDLNDIIIDLSGRTVVRVK